VSLKSKKMAIWNLLLIRSRSQNNLLLQLLMEPLVGYLNCLRLRLLFAKMLFCALEVFAAFVMPSRSAQLNVKQLLRDLLFHRFFMQISLDNVATLTAGA